MKRLWIAFMEWLNRPGKETEYEGGPPEPPFWC